MRHDIRRLDSCICTAAHRRADVRARKYGSVVDAVADEHDRAVLAADFAERAQLILRQQLRVYLVDADRLRHGVRACLTVAGQLEGGIAQGVGYALYERMEINPRSRRTLSTDFLHYRIPQMGDMPRTYVGMVSSHDPYGPDGAKSVGELATVPVAPAIVNAVRRASGIEINSLPLCDKFTILPTERGNVK